LKETNVGYKEETCESYLKEDEQAVLDFQTEEWFEYCMIEIINCSKSCERFFYSM